MVSTSKELPIWPQPTLTEFGTHTSPLLTASDLTYSVTNVDALPREPQAHREELYDYSTLITELLANIL